MHKYKIFIFRFAKWFTYIVKKRNIKIERQKDRKTDRGRMS